MPLLTHPQIHNDLQPYVGCLVPSSLPPCSPQNQNLGAPVSSNFLGPRDPPNRVGHPSEKPARTPQNSWGLLQIQFSQPSCLNVIRLPPKTPIMTTTCLHLELPNLQKTVIFLTHQCFYTSDLTTHVLLNFSPTRPEIARTCSQNGHTMAQYRAPQDSQREPKMVKVTPRWLQCHPKMAPRWSQDSSRWL
jgi:hypothetical protein